MNHNVYIVSFFALFLLVSTAKAQQKKVDFNVRTGVSIGAATPLGIPSSIRKIEGFNPGLLLSLEGGVIYHIKEKWGLATAIRFEQKGMTTNAQVKEYYTTFNAGSQSGSESITGYYTGDVKTKVKNSYLTLPIHVVYSLNSPLSLKAGGFVSLALEKSFTGSASNGYLRNGTPVGEKEEINEADYDFSDQVRPINAGVEFGVDYRISSHLSASALVNWGLIPLMESDFKSIDFKMYNFFGNVGISYRFK